MQDNKILIFSDLHFGIDNSSQNRLDDTVNCVKWIANVAEENSATKCVFAGDWFHHRDEIDVRAMITAKNSLEMLSEVFDEIVLISGNHDYYYNNSNDISSIEMFKNIRSNIIVVDKKPQQFFLNGKTILLTPWFYNPTVDGGNADAMIGHFEYVGGKMNGCLSKIGHSPKSMLKIAPLVFTGHYHLTNEVEYENGKIVTIGSPYQQDWGDYGDNKRVILFDGTEYESVYNQISPQYMKIDYSRLENASDEILNKLFSNQVVQNGFVKIISDGNTDFDKINRITEIGNLCGVRKLEIDHTCGMTSINESIEEDIKDISSKNLRSYVHEFANKNMDDNGLSEHSDKIHKLIDTYFEQAEGAITK